MELLDKVCDVHHDDLPFLLEVRKLFNRLSNELVDHLTKEEEIVFSVVRRLFEKNDYPSSIRPTGRIHELPLSVLEDEHEIAGQLIKGIRALTNNYTPPDHACPTLRFTYVMIHQFDKDLMQHVHIEITSCFPDLLGRFKSPGTVVIFLQVKNNR